MDAAAFANVNIADGFPTLGDGGVSVAHFDPEVIVRATLFLLVGEVGGQAGEMLGAEIMVDSTAIPEPGTLALFGIGLAGLGVMTRRRPKALAGRRSGRLDGPPEGVGKP